jgi:hypothetical protein
MKDKSRYIFLYLALACFLGIILIFVFDGYIGLHDSLVINSGEFPVTITTEQWDTQNRGDIGFIPTASANYGENIPFTYQIENLHFSSFKSAINVSVWNNQVKLGDLYSTTVTAKAFGKGQAEWTLDTTQFISGNLTSGQSVDFTVVIQRGDVERKVIIYVYVANGQGKVIPINPLMQ